MVSPAGPQPVDVCPPRDSQFRVDIRFRNREGGYRLSANRPVPASTARAAPRHSRAGAADARTFINCRE
jgi:hypothetical protein